MRGDLNCLIRERSEFAAETYFNPDFMLYKIIFKKLAI
jgi:hypothetical protein